MATKRQFGRHLHTPNCESARLFSNPAIERNGFRWTPFAPARKHSGKSNDLGWA
jgi:hypothetical protein